MRPLKPHEYLNNVAVDLDVSLHSRRLSWETRLHFDNPTYISTHYSQVSHRPWLLRPWRLGASSHYLGGAPPSLPPRKEGLGFRAQLPPLLCPQVQRDYLQGKLLVGTQADAQVARLAALQHISRAQEEPPSE